MTTQAWPDGPNSRRADVRRANFQRAGVADTRYALGLRPIQRPWSPMSMPSAPPNPTGETLEDPIAFAGRLGDGRLVGMDLGTKTIGLALSDISRMIASPLFTIRRTKFGADAAELLKVFDEHRIVGLVLGLPTNLDGTAGPRVQATRAFARNMNRLTPLPILLWDERLTTAEAERMLIAADQSRRRRAEVVDKLAATIILQNVLDRVRAHG